MWGVFLKELFIKIVLLTALGVGGATVIGSLIGFIFKKYLISFRIIANY